MLATAVSRIDNLEFLSDIVPRTKTYRQIKEDAAREEATAASKAGQPPNGTNGEASTKPIQQMMQRQSLVNGQQPNGQADAVVAQQQSEPTPPSPLVHRTIMQNGHGQPHPAQDVHMTG